MKRALLLLMLAAPATAQTTNDDTAAAELWWDRVGAGFFSDATLQTPRSEFEIRAHWTALSEDDQAAVLARCEGAEGLGDGLTPSLQEGTNEDETEPLVDADLAEDTGTGEAGTVVDDDTSITGTDGGAEEQTADSAAQPEPYTGLAGAAETQFFQVCELIAKL